MKSKFLVLSSGFAMFSMFFGSGNLVFPLLTGAGAQGQWPFAALGFLLTGVLVPFLGLFGVLLFDGCTKSFFSTLGRPATFWLPLITLSLMGPFGVLARCITVAHGSVRWLAPDLELIPFSLIFCSLIFALTLRKGRLVPILGSILTPLLLISLAAITAYGAFLGSWEMPQTQGGLHSLTEGFLKGYQLMDLLAAFFFSSFVLNHVKNQTKECTPEAQTKTFLKAAFVGIGLLSAVYLSLVALGAKYAEALREVPPEEMLGTVASLTMGDNASLVVCCAVALACFTTAVVLATLYADFFQSEVFYRKTHPFIPMIGTLAVAFLVSTLKFSGIAAFIAPILEAMYPALIVLTVMNILHKTLGFRQSKWPVAIALTSKVLIF